MGARSSCTARSARSRGVARSRGAIAMSDGDRARSGRGVVARSARARSTATTVRSITTAWSGGGRRSFSKARSGDGEVGDGEIGRGREIVGSAAGEVAGRALREIAAGEVGRATAEIDALAELRLRRPVLAPLRRQVREVVAAAERSDEEERDRGLHVVVPPAVTSRAPLDLRDALARLLGLGRIGRAVDEALVRLDGLAVALEPIEAAGDVVVERRQRLHPARPLELRERGGVVVAVVGIHAEPEVLARHFGVGIDVVGAAARGRKPRAITARRRRMRSGRIDRTRRGRERDPLVGEGIRAGSGRAPHSSFSPERWQRSAASRA